MRFLRRLISFFKIQSKLGKTGFTIKGFWGQKKHFNKEGIQTGYTRKGFWGERKRYDMNGNLVSYSLKSFWGGYDTYDANGNLIKRSRKNFWGGYNTYDKNGKKTHESYKNFWEGTNHYEVIEPETYVESISIRSSEKKATPKKATDSHSNTYGARVNTKESVKTEEKEKEIQPANIPIFKEQRIDKSTKYYSNIEVCKQEINIQDYARLLVFKYGDISQFPAIAYRQEDKVIVKPLIEGIREFAFDASEIQSAKEIMLTDLKMDIVDNEFVSCGVSEIGKEFEDLLPEYEIGSNGISRKQYEFDCGLVITEMSMKDIKRLLG